MIGLDTNVLVRYITQDDPVQAALATDFIEQHLSSHNPGIISHIVLCETAWVLSRAYHYAHEQVAETLNAILTCQEFVVESADIAIQAWQDYAQGNADFSDYLLGRTHQRLGASHTVTFDRKAGSATTFQRLG
ncbi:MAG: type II toxin-antitoxin system VapC family toxin [Candidatus Thiothrix singaporensis]|uniref:Type II toxin-antitoxin system VapC family toxin n=1 Tax=Candidatus Thiothrix singaporensis TaxID=2799669 RepID=A0A7L6AUD9_9GAMM|nr:MAG: type II toxin-antitoxin system VapC family toxin [Candidatus Thiothrix singaporensis]